MKTKRNVSGLVLKVSRRRQKSKLRKNARCPECKSQNLGCRLACADDPLDESMDLHIASAHCNTCQHEWDIVIKFKKYLATYWCNECHCKVKNIRYNCPKCNSQDLDGIKKKPEIKFYFHIMDGWYLLPTMIVGRARCPEDVGANTFHMGFAFLCFNLQIEFWWNISDVKRIESAEDILELAIKLDSQEES